MHRGLEPTYVWLVIAGRHADFINNSKSFLIVHKKIYIRGILLKTSTLTVYN